MDHKSDGEYWAGENLKSGCVRRRRPHKGELYYKYCGMDARELMDFWKVLKRKCPCLCGKYNTKVTSYGLENINSDWELEEFSDIDSEDESEQHPEKHGDGNWYEEEEEVDSEEDSDEEDVDSEEDSDN
ncbi:hypothetical protein BJ508DRAFT_417095 [Ascobolus immersus RN42]|uniref:Uncharacterized protein n=1 Tax=Ascobolus immersus RN42 TaxID=1160509 RepID=A0A3N4HVZ7_ASCIM|nr:hypothetical protein BJ508DRAFT_417095 [Ascobolus immersus RN42]